MPLSYVAWSSVRHCLLFAVRPSCRKRSARHETEIETLLGLTGARARARLRPMGRLLGSFGGSLVIIAIPFAAALVLLGSAIASVSHQSYAHKAGRIVELHAWSDTPTCLLLDLYLDRGIVNVSDCSEALPYVLVPRPAVSEFAVGDYVSATIYAGSATDLILDHSGKRMHYASAYYTGAGTAAAAAQERDFHWLLTAAVAAIALWVLLALARAVWRAREQRPMVGIATFAAVTTFAPYLVLAALGGTAGGISGSAPALPGLLVLAVLIGLISAITTWSVFWAAKRPEVAEPARGEIRSLAILSTVGATGWLIAVGLFAISLAMLSGST